MRWITPYWRGVEAFLLVTMLLLSSRIMLGQDWERLPLNVGYLDKLVQNPSNPLEIVGYVLTGDLYRSLDGGRSWREIEQKTAPSKKDILNLTFDSRNRLYLNVAFEGLYRSSDGGRSWDSLLVLGPGYLGGFSKVTVIDDGTIFVWMSSTTKFFRSRDDGRTWEEIGPPDAKQVWDMHIEPESGKVIIMLAYEKAIITTDGGASWNPYPLPAPARSRLFTDNSGGFLTLRYIAGGNDSDIYESNDTGRTWYNATLQSIHVTQGDCSTTIRGVKYFRMNDSTEIYSICHTLQRSTDSGGTFHQITNFRVEDAVQVGTELIVSVPLRGLIRSTDLGDTWSPVPSPLKMLRVNEFEFAHAHQDTMFVLMGDWNTNSRSTRMLLESDDGGYVWDTLFLSPSIRIWDLFVDAGKPCRYYVHTGVPDERYGDPDHRYSILSGVSGQVIPDTVLVTTSFPRPTELYPPETFACFPSERFPGWLVASRNTNSIGWSSNRGESWEWRTLPIVCSMVTPLPTQRDPLRIVVAASELRQIPAFDHSGLYLTENGGESFEWINRSDRLGGIMFTTHTDRMFRSWQMDSTSTNYGRTWEVIRTGLDSNTTGIKYFKSHGWTLMTANTGIYIFDEERWKLLLDPEGNSIWDERQQEILTGPISDLDYTGTHVYIVISDRGLYRIATQPVTSVTPPPIPTTGKLSVYPNPAKGQLTIAWREDGEQSGGIVRITDLLGREIVRFTTVPGEGSVVWDCRGPGGLNVQPGLYIVQIVNGPIMTATSVLVIR